MKDSEPHVEHSEGLSSGVFVGSFVHLLDPKRRLTIPSEWRDISGTPGTLYVLPGIDQTCLCVFPAQELVQRLKTIRSHSIADQKARQFARVLGSQSQLLPWDSQGRIRIKDELLESAKLVNQVVLVGAFERFELWDPVLWKASGSMDRANLIDAARYVGI